jgi:N6-adenosine-specific RNA methylase IME4
MATTGKRGRPPKFMKGPMNVAERSRLYRRRLKQAQANPVTVKKQQRRAERERELAERTIAAAQALGAGGKLYGVIYADCPWSWSAWSWKGMSRAPDYPTMALDALKALQVPAAPDCVLFLWAIVPMLPQALELMVAWGFTYRSSAFWVKPRAGTGYWFRGRHELLLVGTRGDVPAPAPGEQLESVIDMPQGKHSEKPEIFAGLIEALYPNVPKLEMFARGGPESGWDRWGNEAV